MSHDLSRHVVEGSYDNMAGSSSLYVTTISRFVAIEAVVVESSRFYLSCDPTYHLIKESYVIKEIFASVFNEISLILVTCVLDNEC